MPDCTRVAQAAVHQLLPTCIAFADAACFASATSARWQELRSSSSSSSSAASSDLTRALQFVNTLTCVTDGVFTSHCTAARKCRLHYYAASDQTVTENTRRHAGERKEIPNYDVAHRPWQQPQDRLRPNGLIHTQTRCWY